MKQKSTKYASLEEMYQDLYALVLVMCQDYTKTWQDQEDIASIVWNKVAQSPDHYLRMDKAAVIAYLRMMVHNTATDLFRAESREQAKWTDVHLLLQDVIERSVEDVVFDTDYAVYLEEACGTLSEKERILILLRFSCDMTYRDISSVLNCSEESARTALYRTKVKLREAILQIKQREEGF